MEKSIYRLDAGLVRRPQLSRTSAAFKRSANLRLDGGLVRRFREIVCHPQPTPIDLNGNSTSVVGQIRVVTRPAPSRGMITQARPDGIHVNVVKFLPNEFVTPNIDR
jgi:hypothetical protein